jgi:hypothetical protein
MIIENYNKILEIIERIFKYIFRSLIILIALLLIVGLFLKKEIKLEDSTIINAPIEQVWEHTNSLTKILNLSDRKILMKCELIGSDGKVGEKVICESDSKGRITFTITRIEEPNYIEYEVKDEEGKELVNVNIKLLPKGEATRVTGRITHKTNYADNLLYLVLSYTNKEALDFDSGELLKLKKLVENQ